MFSGRMRLIILNIDALLLIFEVTMRTRSALDSNSSFSMNDKITVLPKDVGAAIDIELLIAPSYDIFTGNFFTKPAYTSNHWFFMFSCSGYS